MIRRCIRYWNGAQMLYRAGVLVLSTRTCSTRVLNFWYSYFTRTREFQIDSIRTFTRTRGQVLRYLYEYWHEYWYSMVHLWCKGENHHTCEIDSLTYHKRKVPNWFILLRFEYMIHGMWFQIPSKNQLNYYNDVYVYCYHSCKSILPFNFWLIYEDFYFRLKKRHYFPHISWYCTIFAFCF